ncbi:hypothetical protein EYF80_022528 [Liparis tanakae]|uniref:Uncharacterized protein n=1 Tax=Liparis tanakae TaxID=230148 RepID=A0A4Z2HN73_9TELE|nr:hypothetical protein EYF80_022528 [Liparis tanakae]
MTSVSVSTSRMVSSYSTKVGNTWRPAASHNTRDDSGVQLLVIRANQEGFEYQTQQQRSSQRDQDLSQEVKHAETSKQEAEIHKGNTRFFLNSCENSNPTRKRVKNTPNSPRVSTWTMDCKTETDMSN